MQCWRRVLYADIRAKREFEAADQPWLLRRAGGIWCEPCGCHSSLSGSNLLSAGLKWRL